MSNGSGSAKKPASPFIRASCGCIVIPTGRPYAGEPAELVQKVILLWSCRSDNPYGFFYTNMEHGKIQKGRPLTEEEENQLVTQLSTRMTQAEQMQMILGALSIAGNATTGKTDCSPCPE